MNIFTLGLFMVVILSANSQVLFYPAEGVHAIIIYNITKAMRLTTHMCTHACTRARTWIHAYVHISQLCKQREFYRISHLLYVPVLTNVIVVLSIGYCVKQV